MRKGLFGLLAGAAIAFSACQGAATPSPAPSPTPTPAASPSEAASPSPAPSPTPIDYESLLFAYNYNPTPGTKGGKVIISDWEAANQLNPAYSNAFANSMVYAATMRTLFTVTADGHWKADLAAKMPKFSDNTIRPDATGTGFSVDVELRPNLKWSDGQPATMNDFKYTWQFILDPNNPGISTVGWDEIDKIDVTDDLHATVHFKEAFAGFYGVIGGFFFPQHYFTTVDIKNANKSLYPLSPDIKNAVSIGPFKYSTASADTIELVRDDNWAGPADACGGTACLDAVTFKYYPDNKDGMIAAFLAGDVDVAEDLVQSDYDAIKGVNPSIGKALLNPSWLYEHWDMNEAGLGQGKGHPALKDLTVRKAIYQAIDKKTLYQTVFPGAPVPQTDPCVNATPSNYWQLPNATCPQFDVAAANSALDAAGYAKGSDGIRTMPNDPNTKLEFEFCTSTAGFRQTGGEFLKKSLEAIGIQVNLNFVDSTAVLFANWPDVAADTKCSLSHGNYDMAEFAYVLTFDLFGDYYYSYDSEQIPTDANNGNGYNWLRFSSPEMDAALATLKSAIKPEDQITAVYKVQQIYIDQVIEIPIYYRNEARGVSAKLNNFEYNPGTASDMWNIQDWWVTQ